MAQWWKREGDRAGRIAWKAMLKQIVIGNKWCFSRVDRGSQDIITNTGTCIVSDYWFLQMKVTPPA